MHRDEKRRLSFLLACTCVALTLLGCSNDEGHAGEGGSGGDAGAGGAAGVGGTAGAGGETPQGPLTLAKYAESELWSDLERAIAIDSDDVIYLTDGDQVYAVAEGMVSIYLSTADLEEVVGAGYVRIGFIDVGPDDRLYILNNPVVQPAAILASSGRGDVAVHFEDFDEGPGIPHQIGVESPERILLVTLYDGLFAITDTGSTEVYSQTEFQGGTDCGSEAFVVDGADYYYQPGCNGDDLFAGRNDGSSSGLLLESADVVEYFERMGEPDTHVWNFEGLSRHPDGGTVANVYGALIRIMDDGSFTQIPTEPKLWEVDETAGFANGVVAVDSKGQVYIMNWSRSAIYRAAREPTGS